MDNKSIFDFDMTFDFCAKQLLLLSIYCFQPKEVANINGEKVGNASEEEESEDMESEEEERRHQTEDPVTSVKETTEPTDQVRLLGHLFSLYCLDFACANPYFLQSVQLQDLFM